VSARLTPWGLAVFRRGIVKDCAERRVDCRDVFPPYIIERIEDDLLRLASAKARVEYVERYLLSIFDPQRQDSTVRWACRQLAAARGDRRIADLAREAGLSRRALERRFVHHIGAAPKKLARVLRLRHAVSLRRRRSNWAEVAHEAGFYDQSHMIHDFLELYGMTPEALQPKVHRSATLRFSGLLDLSADASR
jgi:AraC-like DNA-binding protein